jgi:tol-pal system protein YbgF
LDAPESEEAQMNSRVLWVATAASVFALGLATSSWADSKPVDPTEKRFQSLEKQLRQLREIVIQAKDTGQPISVRVTNEPDPELATIEQRLDDLEQAARTRNDQIDSATHDLEVAKKTASDLQAELKSVEDRIAKLESQVKAIDQAAAAAATAAGTAGEAGAPPPGSGGAAPPPPPPPEASAAPSVSPDVAYKHAKELLLQGQYSQASQAFQSFVDTYGDSARAPEARYWLGETLYIRGMYPDAAAAYIGAIRGWPQTSWAPDAVVKLARALVALNKPVDACRALGEFDRRYPDATTAARARAQIVRAAAKCGA